MKNITKTTNRKAMLLIAFVAVMLLGLRNAEARSNCVFALTDSETESQFSPQKYYYGNYEKGEPTKGTTYVYRRVRRASQIVNGGEYIFYYGGYAVSAMPSSVTTYLSKTSVSKLNDTTISNIGSAYVFKLVSTGTTNQYYIVNPSSTDTKLQFNGAQFNSGTATGSNYKWNITYTDSNVHINNQGNTSYYIKYNSGFVGTTSGTGNWIGVYKKTAVTTYDITIDDGITNGTVETSPASSTTAGTTVTVTATPDDGYELTGLSYNDGSDHEISIASAPYTFTMPAANVTVSATFSPTIPYDITIDPAIAHGSVTTTPISEATAGTTVTITATPDEGYETSSVSVTTAAKADVPLTDNGDGTYTFTMPAAAVTVSAEFSPITYYYKKVIDDRTDWSGTYLLAGQNLSSPNPPTTYVYTGVYFTNNSNSASNISVSDGFIINPSGVVEVEIEYITTANSIRYYCISFVYDNVTYYLGNNNTGSASGLRTALANKPTSSDNKYLWSIEAVKDADYLLGFGNLKIKNKYATGTNVYLQYRHTTDYKTFTPYTGGSGSYNAGGYSLPKLYEKVYKVEVSDLLTNGTVTVDKEWAAAGDIVTIYTHPAIGKTTTAVNTTPSLAVTGDVSTDYTFTFTMPTSDVVVGATFGDGAGSVYHSITCVPSSVDPVNGYITANAATAAPGTIVTITDVAEDGYKLSSISVTDEGSNPVPVIGIGRTFVMPASNVTATASFCSSSSTATVYQIGETPASCTSTAAAYASIYVEASNPYSEIIYTGDSFGEEETYITAISWYFDKRNTLNSSHYMRMYMKETEDTAFPKTGGTDSSPTTTAYMEGYTLVYEEDITNWAATGAGWYEFRLPKPFKIDAANKNLAVAVFVHGSQVTGKLYWSNNNSRTRCHRYKNGIAYTSMELESTVTSVSLGGYYPATKIEVNSCLTSPKITIDPSITHGTVTTTPENEALEGTEVIVNTAPDAGYGVRSITVTDEDGVDVTITNKRFIMPNKDVTVSVEFDIPTETCNDFEEYADDASTADYDDKKGVLPEGWSYIYTGQTSPTDYSGAKPHLNKGKYSKDGVGIIMSAGNTYIGTESYLITPIVLHEHDSVSFNSYASSGLNQPYLYYGYIVDPANKNTFVQLGQANNILYTSVTDPANDGYTKFAADFGSEGHYLAFRCYQTTRYHVVIDNLCITAIDPDIPSGGDTWVDNVTSEPAGYVVDGSGNVTISSAEGLAWLISVVNGGESLSGKTVNLDADLDMDEHIWVPIGYSSTAAFAGTFNGNNHTISNLHIASSEISDVETAAGSAMQNTGLFGYTNGATIKNVVLTNDNELANNNASGSIGSIVGYANNSTIEFCQSEATLSAAGNITAMGGMVGTAAGTTNVNGVTSLVSMAHETNTVTSVGGVVGTGGTVKTYIANNTISGSGTVTNKSAVANSVTVSNGYVLSDNSASGYTVASGTGYAPSDYTTVTPYTYGSNSNTISNVPMVNLLNDGTPATNMAWKQAKGTRINGGYPIIVRTDDAVPMGCVKNGNLVRHDNVNTLLNGSASTDTVFMYGSGAITLSSTPAGKLYIDEDAALTQDNAFDLTATVGVTIDNTACNGEESRDWHVFSSALAAASIGISYGGSQVHEYGANNLPLEGAAGFSLVQNNAAVYFPNGITVANGCDGTEFDLYAYSEPNYHWVNMKRETDNHYYEDTHAQFDYTNETTYTPGHGYFLSIGDNNTAKYTLLQATGTLNNGSVGPISVTYSGAHLPGYNLLGNPYQSYLDFNAFATTNGSALWGDGTGVMGYKAYLIYDAERGGFDEYLVDAGGSSFSQGSLQTASRYIHPHQGFFVVKKEGDARDIYFNNTMRVTSNSSAYRDEKPSYPLINLICTDSEGKQEVSVIEFNRPSVAGSLKMKGMLNSKGNLYIRYNNEDFGSMFLSDTPEMLPLWFRALEDGVFTLSWSTANGEFNNMHLIDNLTGADIDCNAAQSYTFESKQTDSKARFRLVFTPYGIDEQETVEGESFAFISNGELVVTGNGELNLIDLNGRVLATEQISGEQSRIGLPAVAEGMYLLRLTSNKGVRMQKIVVRR